MTKVKPFHSTLNTMFSTVLEKILPSTKVMVHVKSEEDACVDNSENRTNELPKSLTLC